MKGLKCFLENRNWTIISYENNTSFLHAKFENYEIKVSKKLGNYKWYSASFNMNGEKYTIETNTNEKFIFEELKKYGIE